MTEASKSGANQQPVVESEETTMGPKKRGERSGKGLLSDEKDDEVVEKSPRERYLRFNDLLGKGAYKEVWRSYDTVEGIEVAWNVVNLKNLPAAEKARVINEVRLLDRLEHENIIDFHGSWVNRERGEVVFVTEILSSGSLKKFINKVQVIRWKIVKRWCKQILKALAYLHSQDPPIIHRDIKCDNIFINGATGDLRIGDLGLSTTATIERNGKGQSVLGTPEFMAPELYDENYDEKVDIYAFGMCAVEMITKQLPYAECANATQIYRKVAANIAPDAMDSITDPAANAFVRCCVHADSQKRLSAKELLMHPFLRPDAVFDENEVTAGESGNSEHLTDDFCPSPTRTQRLPEIVEVLPTAQQQVPQSPLVTTRKNIDDPLLDENNNRPWLQPASPGYRNVWKQPAAAAAVAVATADDAHASAQHAATNALDAAAFALSEARRQGYEDDHDVRQDWNDAIRDNSERIFRADASPKDNTKFVSAAGTSVVVPASPPSDDQKPLQRQKSGSGAAPQDADDDDIDSGPYGIVTTTASPAMTTEPTTSMENILTPPMDRSSEKKPDTAFYSATSEEEAQPETKTTPNGGVGTTTTATTTSRHQNTTSPDPEFDGMWMDLATSPGENNKKPEESPAPSVVGTEEDDDAFLENMQQAESLVKSDRVRIHEGRKRRTQDDDDDQEMPRAETRNHLRSPSPAPPAETRNHLRSPSPAPPAENRSHLRSPSPAPPVSTTTFREMPTTLSSSSMNSTTSPSSRAASPGPQQQQQRSDRRPPLARARSNEAAPPPAPSSAASSPAVARHPGPLEYVGAPALTRQHQNALEYVGVTTSSGPVSSRPSSAGPVRERSYSQARRSHDDIPRPQDEAESPGRRGPPQAPRTSPTMRSSNNKLRENHHQQQPSLPALGPAPARRQAGYSLGALPNGGATANGRYVSSSTTSLQSAPGGYPSPASSSDDGTGGTATNTNNHFNVVEGDALALTQGALATHSSRHGGSQGAAAIEEDRSSAASQSIIDQHIDDDLVSISFPYTFDGVAHRVSFDYDLREDPYDVAAEFAQDCGYPIEEMRPFAEFLASVREKHRLKPPPQPQQLKRSLSQRQQQVPPFHMAPTTTSGGSGAQLSAQQHLAQQQSSPQNYLEAAAAAASHAAQSFGPPTQAALDSFVDDGTSSFDDGSSVRKVEDDADLDFDDYLDEEEEEDERALAEQCDRDYQKILSRYEHIHSDRMTKLQQAKVDSETTHSEVAKKYEEQLQDLENKERDITMSRDVRSSFLLCSLNSHYNRPCGRTRSAF